MSVTLDGEKLFDQQQLEIEFGSLIRNSIERSVAGLDGVLSIDLGKRGRKIKQKGVLRAKSRGQLVERIEAISAFLDGDTHTLVIDSGESFADIRMDSFKVTGQKESGSSLYCNYEIIYMQLKS